MRTLRRRGTLRLIAEPGRTADLLLDLERRCRRGGHVRRRRRPAAALGLLERGGGGVRVGPVEFLFERIPRRNPDASREIVRREPRVERLGLLAAARRSGRPSDRDLLGDPQRHRRRPGDFGRDHRRVRQQRLDLAEELLGVERLRHDRVRADPVGALAVEGLERSGQQDHRNARRLRVALDRLADLVAVLLGHHDVGEDQVGAGLADLLEGPHSVAHADELVLAVGKRQLDDLLNRQTVVGQ